MRLLDDNELKKRRNGYLESIRIGTEGVGRFRGGVYYGSVLYLELGVGSNTPVIIKFPFWSLTYDNPDATYACLNYNESFAPVQLADQSICIDGDTADVLQEILRKMGLQA